MKTIEHMRSLGMKMDMPPDWVDPPVLPQHLQWLGAAFSDLGSERNLGFGAIGPIPVTSIINYGRTYLELDSFDFEYFKWMIQGADDAYLAIVNKPPKTTDPKNNQSGKGNGSK